ncbi:MAG: helicase-associated domain-containing protein, partial [Candidatus Nanopelagicales bacterium]
SVRRAMDAGCDAISLLEFLTRVSRTPVPQPLGYLIEDAARSHGVVRIGVATAYIRCDDPATLAAVVAHPRSSDLGITSVAPT